MALALEGIKVVDMSTVAAVPMTARYLGDFGADVVHIENVATAEPSRVIQAGMSPSTGAQSDINYIWEHFNRNKRSMTLDVSQEAGRKILYRLVESADVFLTNLRPFHLERFKIDYDTLSQLNPGLVYGALTGYGKKGPEKDAPAYDHTAFWARSGIPHRLSTLAGAAPGTPPPGFLSAFGDHMAGMILVSGVMTALFTRERTGLGQEVDVSLFHSGVYQLSFDLAGTLVTGEDFPQATSGKGITNPLIGRYRTKDDRWIFLMGLQPQRYWSGFCQAIEREDLEHDPKYTSVEAMEENCAELLHIIEDVFRSKTLDEWRSRLNAAAIPWSPAQSLQEVINDPQARLNDFFISYDHPVHGPMEGIANPVKLSRSPEKVRMAAPEFGQHTEEVLLEHGYTWEDIEQFKDQGAID
ncbi:MAG: CoA transferase [Desulfobacterales bacterium]